MLLKRQAEAVLECSREVGIDAKVKIYVDVFLSLEKAGICNVGFSDSG